MVFVSLGFVLVQVQVWPAKRAFAEVPSGTYTAAAGHFSPALAEHVSLYHCFPHLVVVPGKKASKETPLR
jgi:hypothetical protein